MTSIDRQTLHQFLTGRYDLEGLKTLCLYLNVDYENLDGRTKDSLAREMVRYMERVGRVGELVTLKEQHLVAQKEKFKPPYDENVELYLKEILRDADLLSSSKALNEEIMQELFVRLDNYLSVVILNHLPSNKIEEYIRMIEEGQPKHEIERFLTTNIPNTTDVFKNAFIDFRNLFLSKIALARKQRPQSELRYGDALPADHEEMLKYLLNEAGKWTNDDEWNRKQMDLLDRRLNEYYVNALSGQLTVDQEQQLREATESQRMQLLKTFLPDYGRVLDEIIERFRTEFTRKGMIG